MMKWIREKITAGGFGRGVRGAARGARHSQEQDHEVLEESGSRGRSVLRTGVAFPVACLIWAAFLACSGSGLPVGAVYEDPGGDPLVVRSGSEVEVDVTQFTLAGTYEIQRAGGGGTRVRVEVPSVYGTTVLHFEVEDLGLREIERDGTTGQLWRRQ